MVKTCETLKKKIIKKAAEYLSCGEDELEFTGKSVKRLTPVPEGSGFENEISLLDIGNRAMCFNNEEMCIRDRRGASGRADRLWPGAHDGIGPVHYKDRKRLQ